LLYGRFLARLLLSVHVPLPLRSQGSEKSMPGAGVAFS
jgi:hypothetical protein